MSIARRLGSARGLAAALSRPGLLLLQNTTTSHAAVAAAARRLSTTAAGPSSAAAPDVVAVDSAAAAFAPLEAAEPGNAPAITGGDENSFIITESPVHARFVRMLMMQGKKQMARKIVDGALDILRRAGHDSQKVFNSALDNARPVLEMKPMNKLQVPYPLGPRRAEGLAMKWIINAARKRKNDGGMSVKLSQELLQAYEFKGGAVGKREQVHAMAMANQASAHFRWRGQGDRAVGAVDMDRKAFRPQGVRAMKRFQGPMRGQD